LKTISHCDVREREWACVQANIGPIKKLICFARVIAEVGGAFIDRFQRFWTRRDTWTIPVNEIRCCGTRIIAEIFPINNSEHERGLARWETSVIIIEIIFWLTGIVAEVLIAFDSLRIVWKASWLTGSIPVKELNWSGCAAGKYAVTICTINFLDIRNWTIW
jgi:hypothetical protein